MHGIGYWITKRKELTPNHLAIIDKERRVTYAHLNQKVNQLSNSLQESGLHYGDRCAILAYNCLEFVEVLLATAKLGAILVPLNYRLSERELQFILEDSGATFLFYGEDFSEKVESLRSHIDVRHYIQIGEKERTFPDHLYETFISKHPAIEPIPQKPIDLDTPHIIMYTAGTTGVPKGAILSHGNNFWNAINMSLCIDLTSESTTLTVLPLFHIGGIGLYTLPTLHAGGTVVIQKVFDPEITFSLIQKERITVMFGVPAMFLFMTQHPQFKKADLSSIRSLMSGGAPLPVHLIEVFYEKGLFLQQGFGMSEAAPGIASLGKDDALRKAGSIGKPLFHVEVRVVDEEDRDLPAGEVGELLIRGPNVMKGYWNRPEANVESFTGDWFHTGDLVKCDEEGYLYVVDRKKDMFISGGENVYPAEVEHVLYSHPKIAEVAVIGIPDEKWGEVGKAIVVARPGETLTQEEILNFCQDKLAKYKIPKGVEFTTQLPRNPAGKVLKRELKKTFSS